MKRNSLFAFAGAVGVLCLSACSRMPSIPNPVDLVAGRSTLHVDVPVKPGAVPIHRAGRPISLALADFADGRAGKPGNKLGDVRTTVRGMHSSELKLDQDPRGLLSTAVRAQLAADGFRIAGAGAVPDFTLSGVVKAFSLDIAGRDERLISVEAVLREGSSGDIVWGGVITDKDDRYAGVNGNSEATIVEYLGEGVADFAGKLSAALRDNLARAYPQTMAANQPKAAPELPGVTTLHAAAVREKPVAVRAEAQRDTAATTTAAGIGYLSIRSSPSRAKVYVDDVYFGMTPLKLELPAGVSLLRLKLDGYKAATEKVSVRRGDTTELEIGFQK